MTYSIEVIFKADDEPRELENRMSDTCVEFNRKWWMRIDELNVGDHASDVFEGICHMIKQSPVPICTHPQGDPINPSDPERHNG